MPFPHARHPAFDTLLSELKGVGPKTLARLNEEGLFLTGDLLTIPPRLYQDRRRPTAIADLAPDQEALVEGAVVSARAGFSRQTRRRYLECLVEDDNGEFLSLFWFNTPAYMLKSLTKGRRVRLFGKVRHTGRRLEMAHPDIDFPAGPAEKTDEEAEAKPEIRPVYSPIGEISSGLIKKLLDQSLTLLAGCPPLFPEKWLEEEALNDPVQALAILHSPPGHVRGAVPRPKETRAHRQLALFELVAWRLMMLRARNSAAAKVRRPNLDLGREAQAAFWRTMPFSPSPEQTRVTDELTADLSGGRPMSRLLQGEVGGGKTAVAGAALFFTLGRGGQGAMMAPTEVLARQHFEFLGHSAAKLGFRAVLLTGAMAAKEKKAAREALAEGEVHLAVGSQALLSPATVFRNLSLAVIDEQHRFGVRQRLALRRKSEKVDLLAMSATPIPRSLALMLYGDLESSSLKGLLPGRTPAETAVFSPEERPLAYARFLELLRNGDQGFLVTPRIGEGVTASEDHAPDKSRSLDDIYRDLKKMADPNLTIVKLHGSMGAHEREKAMDDFRNGRSRIMVATSIIEVGVDVPTAGVILIEGAERFGLAQLHQLRGRVGRGSRVGHCLLLPEKSTPASEKRLSALIKEHNGQLLSELDLEMRGPGEQLGLRQSGWPTMTFAALPRDLDLLPRAHKLARDIWLAKEHSLEWQQIWQKLDLDSWQTSTASETLD